MSRKEKPEKNDKTKDRIEQFESERERLDRLVMKYAGTGIKRFYNLDTITYQGGALTAKTKELLGLVASLVLRCDDCVAYHLIACRRQGVNDRELAEALQVALVVGGSITIPHLRRAFSVWDEFEEDN